MSTDNWARRLAGEKVIAYTSPQPEDEGYYRRPITEKVIGANGHRNGQTRIIGWEPVCYFLRDGMMQGIIGKRRMAVNEVTDEGLWSWVVSNPIPKAWFVAAVKGDPWPDAKPDVLTPPDPEKVLDKAMGADADTQINLMDALKRRIDVGPGHNKPPEVEPHIEYGEAIENAIRAAKDLEVTDQDSASIALGAQNRIAELRLAATKKGKAIYQPIYAQYKAIMGQWTPMIEKADHWEKVLDKRYKTWKAEENRKAAKAAAEAHLAQRLIDEANERAAQRAIAQGQPEPPPETPVETAPEPMPAAPVTATYRAPGQRTAPKDVEKWHLDGIDDYEAVYRQFSKHPDVLAVLLKLATQAVKQGQEVTGTRRHFGLI